MGYDKPRLNNFFYLLMWINIIKKPLAKPKKTSEHISVIDDLIKCGRLIDTEIAQQLNTWLNSQI